MHIVYEDVMATVVSETIALKPTTESELMRAVMQVQAMDGHTARRDTLIP